MENQQQRGLFVVWKNYQRRPEVLAPLTNCTIQFLPHLFEKKISRPLDYLLKLIFNTAEILQKRPDFIIAQCPPPFSVFPALVMGIPYIIDAHNPLFQVDLWSKLPFTKYLIEKSQGLIAHNSEILELAKQRYPRTKLFNISDPIAHITSPTAKQRQAKQIMVIASFDPWDEPVELIVDVMAKLEDYTFIVTADAKKLPPELSDRLQQMTNVRLTGFLPTEKYHEFLCTSLAALVLTTSDATQPSGACEALSSDTQLVISKTSLTEKLFGDWAVTVNNSATEICKAISSLPTDELNLQEYRDRWNSSVTAEIERLNKHIASL